MVLISLNFPRGNDSEGADPACAAFIKYKEKGRYLKKLSEWKEALQYVSFIAGEEFDSSNDSENIVAAVQKEVQRKRSLHVAKYPVGLNKLVEDFERRCLDELVQDFENQCKLQERKHESNIVRIFGMGGVGKTTLAKELFNRKHSNYSRACFLFDVREASVKSELPSLQSKLLGDLFDEKNLSFTSTEEGASCLMDRLQRSCFPNFLMVLDDIDHTEQLDALLIMDILAKSKNSLVIVTTRDIGVVITADISVGYHLRGMDTNHGRELFCWHAFGEPRPPTKYEALVDEFVEVCGGLPLSLQALGRHVHRRDSSYWELELSKARKALPRDVKQRLRISFESLDDEEKQVFIDTACFFVGEATSSAERAWMASGWNARHALETLKDKCLVEETGALGLSVYELTGSVLRMHDHLRDLGRELAHELSPPHRLWRPQDLQSLESMDFKTMPARTNIRCFSSFINVRSLDSKITFLLGQPDSFFETSASLLLLEIEGIALELPRFPSWVILEQFQKLVVKGAQLEALRQNGMQLPSQLRKLRMSQTGISENDARRMPLPGMSFRLGAGLGGLQKLVSDGEHSVSKISISGTDYPGLQFIKIHLMNNLVEVDLRMVKTLNFLEITMCKSLEIVSGISDLENLVELKIYDCGMLDFESLCLKGMKRLRRISFDRNLMVKSLELSRCENLKTAMFGCEKLVELRIQGCPELKEMPDFSGLNCLQKIIIDGCGIQHLVLFNCRNLKSVSANFQFF